MQGEEKQMARHVKSNEHLKGLEAGGGKLGQVFWRIGGAGYHKGDAKHTA